MRLPLVGTVRVPPPDQLAFYGVLGGLAVLELIDWPVALAMGLGSALVARHFSELEQREEQVVAPAPLPSRRSRLFPEEGAGQEGPGQEGAGEEGRQEGSREESRCEEGTRQTASQLEIYAAERAVEP